MKTIRQLRTEAKLDIDSNSNLLEGLVRSGLYEENKLTLLRRALNENNTKLSNVERKTLQELAEKLIRTVSESSEELLDEATGKVSDFSKMPPILVLKRRSIRVFGGGQQVAMYWSDVLNRYIAIPFDQQPIMAEAVTWAQQVGYEKAFLAANKAERSGDVADSVRLRMIADAQKAKIVQQYGQKEFDAVHQSILSKYNNPKTPSRLAKRTTANPITNLIDAMRRTNNDVPISLGVAVGGTIHGLIQKPKVGRIKKSIAIRNTMPRIKENFQAKLTVLREQAQDPIWNLDNLDTALSLASFYGPASIPAALGSMAIHAAQGRWEEIPWDVVGALPEVGPTIKAARRAQKIADIADGLSDAKRAVKRSEEPAAQKPNTQEPPVKPKEQETVEQKRKREEEETAARKKKKNDEAWARIRNSRDSFNPNQYGSGTGDQQAAATGLDQRPQTGFINPIAGIAPTRTDVNTTLAARVAAARRAALSEQTLNELKAPTKLQRFLRKIFTNKKGDLDIGNFVGNRGGSSGGDGFQYKKQRPQTGFRNPLESQNPFARARQGNPYDIYDVLSRQMTQANLAFMRSSIKEDTVLPKLYTMIQENVDTKNINIGNDSVLVTKNMADNIIKLFEAINDSNKVKLNKMLNESTDNFYKVLDFAVRH